MLLAWLRVSHIDIVVARRRSLSTGIRIIGTAGDHGRGYKDKGQRA